jgi:hypothetical protein
VDILSVHIFIEDLYSSLMYGSFLHEITGDYLSCVIEIGVPSGFEQDVEEEEDEEDFLTKEDKWGDLGLQKFLSDSDESNAQK